MFKPHSELSSKGGERNGQGMQRLSGRAEHRRVFVAAAHPHPDAVRRLLRRVGFWVQHLLTPCAHVIGPAGNHPTPGRSLPEIILRILQV